MMARIPILILFLLPVVASAHRTVHYDGSKAITVGVKDNLSSGRKHIVQLHFPAGITGIHTSMKASVVVFTIDEHHPHIVRLTAIHPPEKGLVQINTAAGKSYVLAVMSGTKPDDVITVKDKPDEATAQKARRAAFQDDDPLRLMWMAMWAGDPQKVAPIITMQPVQALLSETDTERVELLWEYRTTGYHGFTERITNLGSDAMALWLPTLHDPGATLISLNLDGHNPPLGVGDQPHVIQPGQSVRLHLVYKEP
jgi:hypothetical protein